jgi:peroxiredoxin
MSIRCAGVFGSVALLGTVLATLSLPLAAADQAVCDSKRRVANLNFTLKDMNGKDVALSAYRGKVILLDFWATWCGPCKIEIPGFVDLYTKYQPQGFVVLGVSIDDPVAKLKPFATQFKINYPVLVGLGQDDLQDAFGPLVGYPTSFLIGRDGTICTRHTGLAPKERFEREIKTLM